MCQKKSDAMVKIAKFRLVFIIWLMIIQFSIAQDKRNTIDIIEKVVSGKLSETLTIEDHRGGKHIIFVKNGDIFYCMPKSDTINLSNSRTKSSNPYAICVADTLSFFWREEDIVHITSSPVRMMDATNGSIPLIPQLTEEAKSPLSPPLVKGEVRRFGKATAAGRINIFYRRRFILGSISQWTYPLCIFSKVKEE